MNRRSFAIRMAMLLAAVGFLALALLRLPGGSDAGGANPAPELVHTQKAMPVEGLAAGRFLVASRDLSDPYFSETVVLLVEYSKESAMGLVLNLPTQLPLSRLFNNLDAARDREDLVYFGGPVMPNGVLGLIRTQTRPADAPHVMEDLYVVNNAELLESTMQAREDADHLKVFVGYSGWGAGQLDGEVRLGSWHIFGGDVALVFDHDSDTLWERLVRRTELQYVHNWSPGKTPSVSFSRQPFIKASESVNGELFSP